MINISYGTECWEDPAEAMDMGDYGDHPFHVRGIQARPRKLWSTPWKVVPHPVYGKAPEEVPAREPEAPLTSAA